MSTTQISCLFFCLICLSCASPKQLTISLDSPNCIQKMDQEMNYFQTQNEETNLVMVKKNKEDQIILRFKNKHDHSLKFHNTKSDFIQRIATLSWDLPNQNGSLWVNQNKEVLTCIETNKSLILSKENKDENHLYIFLFNETVIPSQQEIDLHLNLDIQGVYTVHLAYDASDTEKEEQIGTWGLSGQKVKMTQLKGVHF